MIDDRATYEANCAARERGVLGRELTLIVRADGLRMGPLLAMLREAGITWESSSFRLICLPCRGRGTVRAVNEQVPCPECAGTGAFTRTRG